MKHTQKKTRPALGDQGNDQLLLAFDPLNTTPGTNECSPHRLRRVAAGNDIIGYRLQRVSRRTIGFQINDIGLTVRAPRWVTLREIESAIVENWQWIRAKEIAWRHWRDQQQRVATRFVDGGSVQYLGKMATLRCVLGTDADETYFDSGVNEIRVAMPRFSMPATAPEATAAEASVRAALQAWLQVRARCIFTERLDRFSDRIDTRFAGWRLSSARTQWGSCSHDGRIRLNWRLVHFSLPIIDYVIAHELAHLRELNHSLRFWKEVAQLLPGFEAARDQIKRVDSGAVSF